MKFTNTEYERLSHFRDLAKIRLMEHLCVPSDIKALELMNERIRLLNSFLELDFNLRRGLWVSD